MYGRFEDVVPAHTETFAWIFDERSDDESDKGSDKQALEVSDNESDEEPDTDTLGEDRYQAEPLSVRKTNSKEESRDEEDDWQGGRRLPDCEFI
jgi:hypothetical protein